MDQAIIIEGTQLVTVLDNSQSVILDADTVSLPGPTGPDGWAVPIQEITSNSSTLEIDYSLGKHVRVLLNSNLSVLTVIGWPPAGQLARLTLEVHNNGAFQWAFPLGIRFSDQALAPEITQGPDALDIFMIITSDGGTTLVGLVAGQNF